MRDPQGRHAGTRNVFHPDLRLTLDEESRSGARIKVIGVGGGGSNAVNPKTVTC